MKRVVIVGGGIAGKKMAGILEGNPKIEVILVEQKEYMEVPYAVLRALVEPEYFSPKIRAKYSVLLPGVQHIMKKAIGINADDNILQLDDGTELTYDYLVIASGSRSKKWPYLNSNEQKMDNRQAAVQSDGSKLEKADSILIIGAGSVGVELAGEIAYKWKNKKITLINGGSRILRELSQKMTIHSEKCLKKMGVKILNETRLHESDDGSWVDKDGVKYYADIVYQAVGMSPNTSWLDHSHIEKNERGAVKVKSDLRVKGSDCIFAIGDINDVPELKLGMFAEMQASFTAGNIKRLIKDSLTTLKPYKPSKPLSFITIGKKFGAVQLPFAHPHFLIAVKQKDLMTSQTLHN